LRGAGLLSTLCANKTRPVATPGHHGRRRNGQGDLAIREARFDFNVLVRRGLLLPGMLLRFWPRGAHCRSRRSATRSTATGCYRAYADVRWPGRASAARTDKVVELRKAGFQLKGHRSRDRHAVDKLHARQDQSCSRVSRSKSGRAASRRGLTMVMGEKGTIASWDRGISGTRICNPTARPAKQRAEGSHPGTDARTDWPSRTARYRFRDQQGVPYDTSSKKAGQSGTPVRDHEAMVDGDRALTKEIRAFGPDGKMYVQI